MAMLEKHRNALSNHFAPQLGEEVTPALMANFPSRDVEEPATKADVALVKSDLALVKADLAIVKAELHAEIADFKTEMQHAFNRQLVVFTTLLSVAVGILLRAG